MTARQASFRDASIGTYTIRGVDTIAVFDGAQLTYSSWAGAKVSKASFEGCAMAGVSFDSSNFTHCIFKNARLNNAELSRATLLRNDFAHAELNATTAALRLPRASLPNRTVDTVAVGNNYKGAVLDETTRMLNWDRVFVSIDKHLAWGVSTAAMLGAAALLPMEPNGEWLGKFVGQGAALIGVVALLSLAKEKLGGLIQDKLSEATLNLQVALRQTTLDMIRRGANIANAVAAFVRGPGVAAIRRSLAATREEANRAGIIPAVKTVLAGETNIILCDRGHLALALEWLSSTYDRTKVLKSDFIISRVDNEDDAAPSILKFFAGGGMAAFWSKEGKVTKANYWDADEMVPATWAVNGSPPPGPMQAMEARQMFENAVIKDHLPGVNLPYDRLSQQLRAGRDGSILVTTTKDQLPRNPHGPVLVRTDGEQLTEKQAKETMRREIRDDDADEAPAMGM